MKKQASDILYAVWTGLEALVFGGFLVFSRLMGGGADHITDGKYFLANHGVYTEVSYPVYEIIRVWEILFFASIPIYWAGCALIVAISSYKRKKEQAPK